MNNEDTINILSHFVLINFSIFFLRLNENANNLSFSFKFFVLKPSNEDFLRH